MRNGPWLAALSVILLLAACPAHAEDCPAKTNQMDDILVALNEAPSCDRAMKVFEACEYVASGDVQFGAVVEKKCESDFLARLRSPKKQAYQREMIENTATSPEPCTDRSRPFAGRWSPSVTRIRH